MIEIFENILNVYSNDSITTTTIASVLIMVLFLAIYEFFQSIQISEMNI